MTFVEKRARTLLELWITTEAIIQSVHGQSTFSKLLFDYRK